MHSTVEGLSCERFLMNGAVRIAVEQAADAILQFDDPLGSLFHKSPGERLIVDPTTPRHGIAKMLVKGIRRVEHAVIAALHHPCAAALPEQAFHRNDDPEIAALH